MRFLKRRGSVDDEDASLAAAREFMPSLLALEKTPPNPLGRRVLWVLTSFLALLLIASFTFSVDEVAIAPGKIVPSTFLKVVQPSEQGIVREILVQEGDLVHEGQVLMRMDSTITDADYRAIEVEHETRRWQLARLDAQLGGNPMPSPGELPSEIYKQALTQYHTEIQSHEAQLAEERSILEQGRQELAGAEQMREKLSQVLPLYQERESAVNQLVSKGYASKMEQMEKRRERIEAEQDLRVQEHRIESAQAVIAQSNQRIRQIEAMYRSRLQAERADVAMKLESLAQELEKLRTRQSRYELKAPQDGIVKELSTHTPGTVVGSGTVLLTLVPRDDKSIAEVWIDQQDAGFVREGQDVKLKLSAYSFQKYGMIDGTITHIGADASDRPGNNESDATRVNPMPSAYRARVSLDTQYLEAGDRKYALRPGMQVVAEIKLGKRKVIEYLLSPIRGTVQEAARER